MQLIKLISVAALVGLLAGCDGAHSFDGVYTCNSVDANKPFAFVISIQQQGGVLYDGELKYTPTNLSSKNGIDYSYAFPDGGFENITIHYSLLKGYSATDLIMAETHELKCDRLSK